MEAIVMYSSDPSPPSLFLKEGGTFWLPPPEGGSKKLKKGGGSTVQGQVFLKGKGLELFLFNAFKVYHFYI